MRVRFISAALLVLLVASGGFGQVQLKQIVSGLSSPVYVTNAHDGSNRLFVIEQPGRILVLQPGPSAPAVFLDIRNRVSFSGEQGLLGLTFHPRVFSEPSFFRRLHAGWRRCYSHQRISYFTGEPECCGSEFRNRLAGHPTAVRKP